MSQELAQLDGNILHGESWERLAKFYALNVVVGVVIVMLIGMILFFFGSVSLFLALVLGVGVVLSGTAFMLSAYERWRGCQLTK
jgi:hypothetical protein